MMSPEKSNALIVELARQLRERESWCGETHLQKTAYFLKELMKVPLSYDFILYKYGPYSFDLTEQINILRADDVFRLQPHGNYGPTIVEGKHVSWLTGQHQEIIKRYQKEIEFIAEQLADKKVADLERLGTALYVTRENQTTIGAIERAERLHQLKPHISLEEALEAVQEVDTLIEKVRIAMQ
ncbi:MAG TPA: hypothetical protein PLP71_11170 [Syntrophomonadaceae bacterium]|nr:hypothetical protein [Syntrophomonadaceae bacterium]